MFNTIPFAALAALALTGLPAAAQTHGTPMGQGMGHGPGHMHEIGPDGAIIHDTARMPGLRGLDATPQESAEMENLFRNFDLMGRDVDHLPDGIVTHTFTDDADLRAVLVSHVVGMIARVQEGRDPQVFVQSPTLAVFFEHRDAITTVMEPTDTGIRVTQTSDDPAVVAALHLHADEVTDMVERGMEAVHDRMARQMRMGQ